MSTSRTTAYLWASVLAVAISSVAIAQQSVSAPAQQEANIPAQIVARTTGVTASQETRSAYKKATWQKHQKALKAGTGTSAIPPTDCPPLPAQDCLDTWDDELTTSSPSR